jgi:coenzyme F420-reducing hydrogenase alpha subunit
VGGFYQWPEAGDLKALLPDLEWGLEAARACADWSATLPYPELEIDYDFVALHHPNHYAVIDGEVWSSSGRKLSVPEFETAYMEEHVRHSNALHGHKVEGGNYLVGPLARLNLNHEQLLPAAQEALKNTGLQLPVRNPYKALIARAIELVHYYELAIQLVKKFDPQGPAHIEFGLKAGEGSAATEAPRGLLYHRYLINDQGLIKFARITPPTAQNLPRIEADLMALAPSLIQMPEAEATLTAEHLVRSYDPCISCATHFLKLKVEEI